MKKNNLCSEIAYMSLNHDGEQLCGDHVEIDENELLSVADKNNVRIFILDYVRMGIILKPYYREGRKSRFPLGAYRQRVGNGFDSVADIKPCGKHGGYYR